MRLKIGPKRDGQRHDSGMMDQMRNLGAASPQCLGQRAFIRTYAWMIIRQRGRKPKQDPPTSPSPACGTKVRRVQSPIRRNAASNVVLVRKSHGEGECRDLLLYRFGRFGRSLVMGVFFFRKNLFATQLWFFGFRNLKRLQWK